MNPLLVVALFALVPLQWIDLGAVGGVTLRPPYLAVFALLALALTGPRQILALQAVVIGHAVWLVPYLVYIGLLSLALVGSEGQGIAFRQVFFLLGFLAVAAAVTTARDIAGLLRRAGGIGLLSFVVATEVFARQAGQSWALAIPRFVAGGDLNYVIYDFFRASFNAIGGADDKLIGAAEKNGLSVAVFLALVLYRAGRPGAAPDRPGQAVTVAALFLLMMLNTRSVLLAAFVALPLAAWLALARDGVRNLGAFAAKTLAFVLLAVAAVAVLSAGNAVFDALGARFAFDDASTGSRFEQWRWALWRIEESPFWGAGYAEIRGQPVHNLFLGAWMHAGLPAFLLVSAAYLALAGLWLRHLAGTVLRPGDWHLPLRAEWVAVLPVVPLFRVWLSGDAGHPIFVEWLALAVFAGALAANAHRARRSGRPAAGAPAHFGLQG